METLQIRLPKELIKKAQILVDRGLYSNKSEILRDAIRRLLTEVKVEDMQSERKFIVLFSSDLHGNIEQYTKFFQKALESKANAVILGGDITPKNPERRTPESQKEFLLDNLFPIISSFNEKNALRLHECKVYMIMGNDDFKSNYNLLRKNENKIGYKLIHNKFLKLHEDFKIIGYSFVPLTPFKYKDWEKLDLSDINEITTKRKFIDTGIKSKGNKLIKCKINLKERTRTIEKDLRRLFKQAGTGKIILVSHAPPKNTKLDMINAKEHVGSEALRKVVEETQPYLVLSGHIHETVAQSGTFKDRLGDTTCMTSGNSHLNKNISLLEFDLYSPEKARPFTI
jgi:Icc-related predicted phosphoesterase